LLQGFETVVDTYRGTTPFADAKTKAIEWILQARDEPFMAWVHFNNAHHPYNAPGMPADMFMNDEHYQHDPLLAPLPQAALDLPVPANHPFRRQILRPDLGGIHPSAAQRAEPTPLGFYVARYDAGIASADAMIGGLLDRLRGAGVLENTIVVVVGDHGESIGKSNYYFGHGRFPYDDCARVPLIVREPGDLSPRRCVDPVPAFAVMPTVLDLVGIAPPKGVEAPSLVPTMHGEASPRYVFTESGYQIDYTLSVRDDTWKLIYVPNELDRSLQEGTEYELYNLRTDPGEHRNLYSDAPPDVARLRTTLHAWSDPWIDYAYGKEAQRAPVIDDATLQKLRSLGYID
jgi:arylsulfatase A-like enzyme